MLLSCCGAPRTIAQPKHPDRFSLIASNMSNIDPNSKTMAPMKAVIPPPYSSSFVNFVSGRTSGSQTKNALITQITLPIVNTYATSKEMSQTG